MFRNWSNVLSWGQGILIALALILVFSSISSLLQSQSVVLEVIDEDVTLLQDVQLLSEGVNTALVLTQDFIEQEEVSPLNIQLLFSSLKKKLGDEFMDHYAHFMKKLEVSITSFILEDDDAGLKKRSHLEKINRTLDKMALSFIKKRGTKEVNEILSVIRSLIVELDALEAARDFSPEQVYRSYSRSLETAERMRKHLGRHFVENSGDGSSGLTEIIMRTRFIAHSLVNDKLKDPTDPDVQALVSKFEIERENLTNRLSLLKGNVNRIIKEEGENFKAIVKKRIVINIILSSVIVFTIIIVAYVMNLSIKRPFKKIMKGVEEFSQGNLDWEIETKAEGDFKILSKSLNDLSKEVLKRITENKSLVRTLCHDMANPLAIVSGYTKLLDRNLNSDKLNQEDCKKWINEVVVNTKRIHRLVDEVRELTAIASGKKEISLHDVDLQEIFNEVEDIFSLRFKEKNIILIIHNKLKSDEFIKCSRIIFQNNVINNLVSNAIKFSHRNSKILIEAEAIDNEVVIKVVDGGIGIPANIMPDLFSHDKATSRKGLEGEIGTGFGLPLAKACIDIHKGRIEVLSRSVEEFPDEHGTTFIIYLPLEKSEEIIKKVA